MKRSVAVFCTLVRDFKLSAATRNSRTSFSGVFRPAQLEFPNAYNTTTCRTLYDTAVGNVNGSSMTGTTRLTSRITLQASSMRFKISTCSSHGASEQTPRRSQSTDDSWQEVKDRLQKVDTAALCDGSGKQARVISTVKPLKSGYKMIGRAHTVKLPPGDFLTNILALQEAAEDDILMIDAGWCDIQGKVPDWPVTGGMFGELLAAEAERIGLGGLVIDGNCRDAPMLKQLNIPVFSRGLHPNAGTANKLGSTGGVVVMGGMEVRAGDVVLGDDDGVVVASMSELLNWLPKAEEIIQTESRVFAEIRAGRPLVDLTNYHEHIGRIREGKPSSLSFSP